MLTCLAEELRMRTGDIAVACAAAYADWAGQLLSPAEGPPAFCAERDSGPIRRPGSAAGAGRLTRRTRMSVPAVRVPFEVAWTDSRRRRR